MMKQIEISEIARNIKQATVNKKPILIGIDGFGGSGKSTLAEKLASALDNVTIISMDDFIIKERLRDESPDKVGFDRARLEHEVLMPASQGATIRYRKLDWERNELIGPVTVPEASILIIEGISCFHPDIEKYYDYKIWVDTPIETAKRRGKQRDAGNENEQHWDVWAVNDLAYQAKNHPELRADYIINNDGSQSE